VANASTQNNPEKLLVGGQCHGSNLGAVAPLRKECEGETLRRAKRVCGVCDERSESRRGGVYIGWASATIFATSFLVHSHLGENLLKWNLC
jgi:hypothetical protein